MIQREVLVTNRTGLHARPAAMIAQTASMYDCEVYIRKGAGAINAKSIMGVIAMSAGYGTSCLLQTSGHDEKQAIDALLALFETKFEED